MNNTNTKQTYFDSLVTDRRLQLAKAVIPYIGKREGGLIAIYVKIIELENAMNYAKNPKFCSSSSCSENSGNNDITGLFDVIKDYMDDDMAQSLEMIMSLMEMIKSNPDAGDDILGNYMDMFKDMM